MRVSSDSPKCDDERDSEMEHPFKNEIEIKGLSCSLFYAWRLLRPWRGGMGR